ncbi:hypothetical protein AYO39_00460 [Actinobacteria bacterium SCGC AG-212-D09]|nr:hypothetical protein AYO39_00460 [Actinobacteria bacterium SCGC AG-212-D09]
MGETEAKLVEARRLYDARELDRSEALYREVVDGGERTADAYYGLGLVSMLRGNLPDAASRLRSCLEQDPSHVDGAYVLGQVSERSGWTSEAISCYGRVLARKPEHEGALKRIAALAQQRLGAADRAGPAADRGTPRGGAEAKTAPVKPPMDPASRDSFVGIARGYQRTTAPFRGRVGSQEYISFTLESYLLGPDGYTRGPELSVEMRSLEIKGNAGEGHWVEIPREAERDGALEPKEFRDLSRQGAVIKRVRKIFYQ